MHSKCKNNALLITPPQIERIIADTNVNVSIIRTVSWHAITVQESAARPDIVQQTHHVKAHDEQLRIIDEGLNDLHSAAGRR